MTTPAVTRRGPQDFNERPRDPRVIEIGRLLVDYLGAEPVAGRRIECEREMAAGFERLLGAFAPELTKGIGRKLLTVLGGRMADLMGEAYDRGYAKAKEIYRAPVPALAAVELELARAALAKHGTAAVLAHIDQTGELPS